jgi:hypothetical protein
MPATTTAEVSSYKWRSTWLEKVPLLKNQKPRKDYADSPDDSVSLATPKKGEISCSEALQILVDEQGVVSLNLLDPEVSYRFLSGSSKSPCFATCNSSATLA